MQQAKQPLSPAHDLPYYEMANAIRALAMDAVERANSGHPGMPMGMADVATVLFGDHLVFDPTHPYWPNRDRFLLSAGHGSMLQYALLYLTGYEDMTLEELKRFRQLGAKTAGHPEYGHAAGIETTTGPLGQGLGNAVGMALAERLMAARFGDDAVGHYTYVVAGDGCLMEGISQEAISLAGHLKLGKLIVLFDDNKISIDGPTSLTISEDTLKRFEASGWHTQSVDGHHHVQVSQAIAAAKASNRPSIIACDTTIAFGAPSKAGTSGSHGSPLGKTEIEGTRLKLGWSHAEFHVPENVLDLWRAIGKRGNAAYDAWEKTFDRMDADKRQEFERLLRKDLPSNLADLVQSHKRKLAESKPHEATRKSSENVLEALAPALPELLGGSADLTGSNNTKTKAMVPVTADNYAGRYIYYGVREHAMAAAMNGIALYGGFIPYGGTFLVFADYCRPAIRLSALMKQRVIYVMTHDSIGLGEDGPTHQPVEHLASLRAIPNLYVFRPADATETTECWALAIAMQDAPSLLSLTRQNLPALRLQYAPDNLCARGGYIISKGQDKTDATLIATGSEVSVAIEAQAILADKGISTNVVSLPCWELFDQQPPGYREQVLGKDTLKIAIEAAASFGWERYIGSEGIFIGMTGFGASGPAQELYHHFGITAERVVSAVLSRMAL